MTDEDNLSTEELKNLLDQVKKIIDNDGFSDVEKGMLKEELTSFIDHNHGLDKEAISCLFWGWWIRNQARNAGFPIDDSPQDNKDKIL